MRGTLSFWWPHAAATASGLLTTLAFPPFDQGWIVWISLTPLLAALWRTPRANGPGPVLHGALLGFLFGLAHFYTLFHWITTVTFLGWIVLIPYLALYPALWGAVAGMLANPRLALRPDGSPALLSSGRNLLTATTLALVWIALEWLRGWLFTGFGWNTLGVALHRHILLLQVADIAGMAAVSFQIVLINTIAVLTVLRVGREVGRVRLRPHYDFSLSLALVVVTFSYGVHRTANQPDGHPLKIAAVQPDIPQFQKWDPDFMDRINRTFDQLTGVALAASPDLLVWPEASTPLPVFGDQRTYDRIRAIADSLPPDARLLLGTLDHTPDGDHNAAVLLAPDPAATVFYHKLHLVPFGEYIPFRNSFPLFAWIVGDLVPADFDPGAEPVVFPMDARATRIAPLICFEDTLDRVVRRFLPKDPNLFVNITNDGWFLRSAASRQHLINALPRCIEFRRPMVRCGNSGVTACIDPAGRVTHLLTDQDGSTFTRGVLIAEITVPDNPPDTLFARTGNVLPVAALALTLALVVRRGLRRPAATPRDRRKRR